MKAEHVGIIPDGIGRWARQRDLPLEEAYKSATKLLFHHISAIYNHGSKSISVYFSSEQNFRRHYTEIEAFCNAEAWFCSNLLPALCEQYKVKVHVAGNPEMCPTNLQESLQHVVELTNLFVERNLYLCVAYDPLRASLK